ncbi:MAG: hypothetical protein PHS92_05300 [Candidatus Gracilibacteria bacterium]|nr:hypothetical protein [Candidatus Gracilibacteria bacterium]
MPLEIQENILRGNNALHIIPSVRDNFSCVMDGPKAKPKKTIRRWNKQRIIQVIWNAFDEYKKRKEKGEDIIFNTTFFLRSSIEEVRTLAKTMRSILRRTFLEDLEIIRKINDFPELFDFILPDGDMKKELIGCFEKGWTKKRVIRTLLSTFKEYEEKYEHVVFNHNFFLNSKNKDAKNMAKKLKSCSKSALGEIGNEVRNIKDLIILALPEGDEKRKILEHFKHYGK